MFTLNSDMEQQIIDRSGGPAVVTSDYLSKFLHARALYIASCREEGQSDEQIYETLYMDGPAYVNGIHQALKIT